MQSQVVRGPLYVCISSGERLLGRPREALPFSRCLSATGGASWPRPRLLATVALHSSVRTLLDSSSARLCSAPSPQRAYSTNHRVTDSSVLNRVKRMHKKPQRRKRLNPDYFTGKATASVDPRMDRLIEPLKRLFTWWTSLTGSSTSGTRGLVASGVLAALRARMQSRWWLVIWPALIFALWPKTVLNQDESSSAASPLFRGAGERLEESVTAAVIGDATDSCQVIAAVLKCPPAWKREHSAAQLLRAPLHAYDVDPRLHDALLALSLTWNPLYREYIAATVDTSEKRSSCVCLADIIEDLEAFDEGRYPHGMSESTEQSGIALAVLTCVSVGSWTINRFGSLPITTPYPHSSACLARDGSLQSTCSRDEQSKLGANESRSPIRTPPTADTWRR
jgi:hypothetical protein